MWWGADGSNVPRIKRFLSEVRPGKTPQTLWTYQEVGHTQAAKKTLLKYVPFEHTENVLNSVKPVELLQRILQLATSPSGDDIVLDFFSGSGSTAHAVLAQNAIDQGNRRFVAVQVHEPLRTPEPEFDSILGMSMMRIRNVATEIAGQKVEAGIGDLGYRMVRIDSTNMMDVLRSPDETLQLNLGPFEVSVKPGRTSEDLLLQVMLDWGLDLSLPIRREKIAGFDVFDVDGGGLLACFDLNVNLDLVRVFAQRQPARAVFRDDAFATDAERINAEQIFKELSADTSIKAI